MFGLAIGAAVALSGCGTAAESSARVTSIVRVDERDFRILLRPARVAAGRVEFLIRNAGPVDHEFIVIRGAQALLLRKDGITIAEDELAKRKIASLEPAAPGTSRAIWLQLRPGEYQVVCNMAGHYMGGMHAVLQVR